MNLVEIYMFIFGTIFGFMIGVLAIIFYKTPNNKKIKQLENEIKQWEYWSNQNEKVLQATRTQLKDLVEKSKETGGKDENKSW